MKNLKIIIFCFFTAIGFSQMTLKKLNGSPINDGDVLTFSSVTDPDNYLGLKIYNNSPNIMRVKAEVVSITNADGTGIQLCFGNVCVSSISPGFSYPTNNPASIPAQGVNGNFDHFLNENTGINSNQNVEYILRFYQLDSNGLEIGNSVTFTYKYLSTLANNSFTNNQNTDVKLKSNIVNNSLEIDVLKNINTKIFDSNGKLLIDKNLVQGSQSIDISNLTNGVYFLSIYNDENKNTTIKFIKK